MTDVNAERKPPKPKKKMTKDWQAHADIVMASVPGATEENDLAGIQAMFDAIAEVPSGGNDRDRAIAAAEQYLANTQKFVDAIKADPNTTGDEILQMTRILIGEFNDGIAETDKHGKLGAVAHSVRHGHKDA